MVLLNEEQKLVQKMVRDFAKTELTPIATELDKSKTFPKEIVTKLANLGLLGITLPQQYGGAELDYLSYCIIIEELSKVLGSLGLILITHNTLVGQSILKYGDEKSKKTYLPKLATGEVIGAFCLEEMSGKIETNMERINNKYRICGEKFFVPNAEVAQVFVVIGKLEDKLGMCILPREKVKIKDGEPILGMRSAGIKDVEINEVEVEEGEVSKISSLEEVFNLRNLGVAALGVGIIQASLDESVKYSKERKQFGQPICNFQLVQEMLAYMQISLIESRTMVWHTAYKWEKGETVTMDIAVAKVGVTDKAMNSAIKAIQVHGGYGYTTDYPVERFFRDAKVAQVWGGNFLEQKLKIAKLILR